MITRTKAFLITIDTEGDNLWSKPMNITTENSKYLIRFQTLCERYGFKPTYLTNYEMAIDEEFYNMARNSLKKGTCEIGMHLHAWNSPPEYQITENDYLHHPFLVDYPDEIMEEKVFFMTRLLENRFDIKVYSHRSGRWAMDTKYMNMLEKYGYQVDCSVVPGYKFDVKNEEHKCADCVDFTKFSCYPYFPDRNDFALQGDMNILELPVTLLNGSSLYNNGIMKKLSSKNVGRLIKGALRRMHFHEYLWLRPRRNNLSEMKAAVDGVLEQELPYAQFMLHSSEFMPGGSPTFRTLDSVELLYKNLEELFIYLKDHNFEGKTLKEFRDDYVNEIS